MKLKPQRWTDIARGSTPELEKLYGDWKDRMTAEHKLDEAGPCDTISSKLRHEFDRWTIRACVCCNSFHVMSNET